MKGDREVSVTLWICPECGTHEFILATVTVLPFRVAVLCISCGAQIETLEKEGDNVKN